VHDGSLMLDEIHVLDNSIAVDGARALAESLKQNTTITSLNLGGMLEIECLTVCRSNLTIFRKRHWLRGSPCSGRVFEAEYDHYQPESRGYVRN
jgi:hypothetical protein